MTTTTDRAPTVSATHRGAGQENVTHRSRDESRARIQTEMLELAVTISRRAALLEASPGDPAQSSEDLAALAWIQRSLEDVEATVIGLSEANRQRSAAFQVPAPSSAGNLVP